MSFRILRGWEFVFTFTVGLFLTSADFGFCQDRQPASERVAKYAKSIEELDYKYTEHIGVGKKLIGERQDTLNRLTETNKMVAQIVDASVYSSFELAQAELAAMSVQTEMDNQIMAQQKKGPALNGLDVRFSPQWRIEEGLRRTRQNQGPSISALAKQNTDIQVYYDMVLHQMKTLNEAGKLAVQRHMSQIRELERIAKEMVAWGQKNESFFHQYWDLADVLNLKSDLELDAAIEQLEKSSDENPGAAFLKAVTLTRLERYDEALQQLALLKDLRPIQCVVLGLKAEILVRTDKKKEAAAVLRQTLPIGLNDPRVRMHRAVALAASGQLRQAVTEWEAILKIGGHEIAARKGISWIHSSDPNPTDRGKSKAIENANLAMQLGGDDWSNEMAIALANAVNGEKDKAIESAKKAAELTIGTNKAYCEEVIEQLEEGNKVSWRF